VAGGVPSDSSVGSASRSAEEAPVPIDPSSRERERDQADSDRDQTLADSDQAAADNEQAAADSDQAASDNEQVASFRDLARGGEQAEHKFTRELRDRSTERREKTTRERVDAAAARDAIAQARDAAALERDQAADRRDRELAASDDSATGDGRARQRAARKRRSAAADRAEAAEIRAGAAEDRERAARDREQAARDREQAQADREALLHQLAIAETDALTGARTRAAGLVDLDHEINRARRAENPLVAAYVDVVGLKAVNDTHGHSAGDALLQRVVRGIRDHLRPYDLIIRLGGDEFLCAMSSATIQEGRQRFANVQATLATGPDPCRIKIGFAALAPEDSVADLIERADAELPTSPRR
jgi:diguanylate cyclase (GGDEF)-like protein